MRRRGGRWRRRRAARSGFFDGRSRLTERPEFACAVFIRMLAGRTFDRKRRIAVYVVGPCADIGDVLENAKPYAACAAFEAARACNACGCGIWSYFRYAREPAPSSGHLALHCWAIDLVLDPNERLLAFWAKSVCQSYRRERRSSAQYRAPLRIRPCARSATMSIDASQLTRDDSVTARAAGRAFRRRRWRRGGGPGPARGRRLPGHPQRRAAGSGRGRGPCRRVYRWRTWAGAANSGCGRRR